MGTVEQTGVGDTAEVVIEEVVDPAEPVEETEDDTSFSDSTTEEQAIPQE